MSQAWTFGKFLELLAVTELHHGDCTGADALMAKHARLWGIRVVAHPPTNDAHRAFEPSDEVRDSDEYLRRNRAIVAKSQLLIAMPDGPERAGSGTWYTIHHAVDCLVPVQIIQPDGSVVSP